jgi:hypothetical protein
MNAHECRLLVHARNIFILCPCRRKKNDTNEVLLLRMPTRIRRSQQLNLPRIFCAHFAEVGLEDSWLKAQRRAPRGERDQAGDALVSWGLLMPGV